MKESYKEQLSQLAAELVTPQRFSKLGQLALFTPVELPAEEYDKLYGGSE